MLIIWRDPKKIAAIQEMEPPRNKQERETLLEMVNYLAKFTPNLAETTAPMRSLLKKDSEFVGDCAQQTAFDKMKLLITSAGTLTYYDVKKEDRECDNGAESEPTINQRPTVNPQAPVMGNEPCTTRSGRVVKPRVILDL